MNIPILSCSFYSVYKPCASDRNVRYQHVVATSSAAGFTDSPGGNIDYTGGGDLNFNLSDTVRRIANSWDVYCRR